MSRTDSFLLRVPSFLKSSFPQVCNPESFSSPLALCHHKYAGRFLWFRLWNRIPFTAGISRRLPGCIRIAESPLTAFLTTRPHKLTVQCRGGTMDPYHG